MAVAFRDSKTSSALAGPSSGVKAMMPGFSAITARTPVASNNAGGGTTITCTLPTGRAVDDVLVMGISVRGGTGTTITLPQNSGAQTWTLLDRTNSGTTLAQATYWKLATSTDVSDTTVVVTITSNKASAVIYAVKGADTGAPAAAQYGGQANASSLTISYAALGTWSSSDGLSLLFGGMAQGANTVGTATNYTNGANSSSTGASASSRTQTHGSHRELAAVTTVGALTEVWTGTAAVNIGSQVFIKQAAGSATVVDGDVMLMTVMLGSTTTYATLGALSGWTVLASGEIVGINRQREYLLWRVAASEPSSYSLTSSGGGGSISALATIMAFSGVDTTQPVAAQYGVVGHAAGSTNMTCDALGSWSSTDGVDVVSAGQKGASADFTAPGSYTTPSDNRPTPQDSAAIEFFYRLLTGVTTVGAITITSTSTAEYVSQHCFLKVIASGGGGDVPMPYVGGGYYP